MNMEKKGSSTRLQKKVIELPKATQKHGIPRKSEEKHKQTSVSPTEKA